MELQELYNSQQLLTAELSDRLEKTEVRGMSTDLLHCVQLYVLLVQKLKTSPCCMQLQKKLEETEHALFDLEEKHRQANATIKEKEFLIANLLRSGQQYVMLVLQKNFFVHKAFSLVILCWIISFFEIE